MAAANTGIGDAAEARARADEAFTEAVNAQATANTARLEAFAAQETADTARREAATALASAVTAQATGDLARTEAAAAQGTADTALVNAVIAQSTASAARTEAAAAQGTADRAIVRSNALGTSTAAALGGGSTYDAETGQLSAPAYRIGGRSYDNAGSAFAAVDDRLGQIDTRIDGAIGLSQRVRKEARRGIAAAVALSPAPFPSAPGRTSYTANTGLYRGEAAFSASIAHRLDVEAPFAVTGGLGFAGGRDLAVRVGVAGEF